MVLLPKNRAPTHAGELLEELIEDFAMTQTEVAKRTAMPFPRVNEIVRGKRGITPDTALRLARLFGTTADLWLNYQLAWDLWHAREQSGPEIDEKVRPLARAARVTATSRYSRASSGRSGGARAGVRRRTTAGSGGKRRPSGRAKGRTPFPGQPGMS
jgi:addiction module HigA family antidote